jgi:hypothetical protein
MPRFRHNTHLLFVKQLKIFQGQRIRRSAKMTEIWRSISDAATNAYENGKEQLHDHPLLDTALVVSLTVAGAVVFKGKLAEFWPSSKALLGAGEALAPVIIMEQWSGCFTNV